MANDVPAPTAELKPINSRELRGHLGHLTQEQQDTLKEFKQRLQEKGYYTPPKRDQGEGEGEASHDDVTLVRFLRARKFDISGAYQQFTSAEDWRRSNKVDELYDSFDLKEFDLAAKLYPQWTGRRDRNGLPVYVFKVGALTKKATDEYVKDPSRLNPRMIALYEHMVQFVLPFCSAIPHEHQEVPISGCATIVDISNVSLMRFWQLKAHMQRASALASANYAETLGSIYLVGAPNFFSTVWGWIAKWFDPGTVDKIFILPSDSVLSTLSTHIDPESIPQEYGGTLDWTYGTPSGPLLDDSAKEVLGLDQVPEGPVRWISKLGGVVLKGSGRDKGVEESIERELEEKRSTRGNNTPVESGQGSRAESMKEESKDEEQVVSTANKEQPDDSPQPTEKPTTQSASSTSSPSTAILPTTETATIDTSKAPPPVGFANQIPSLAPTSTTTTATNGDVQHGGKEVDGEERQEHQHDIHVAARENPSAPVKDLAATLEGTTL